MTTTQELEEMDFGRGPILWDADPDVCCAAFQLGACVHTEGGYEGDDEGDDYVAVSVLASPLAADEPF